MKNRLFLSTRKGLITFLRSGQHWRYEGVHFLGIPVSYTYIDSRTDTWWACLDHGHWGNKLHRSRDAGQHWEEVEAPRYPEGSMIKDDLPASVRYLWAFAQGAADQPGRIYVGTEPGGLFYSDDDGDHFKLVESLWNYPGRAEQWFGGGRDYAGIHSILVDPRDSQHLYVGISVAGVFESKDGGTSWAPRNKGLRADFLPDPAAEVGQDPHLLVACQSAPDHLWQQNHCGIFRSVDAGAQWQDVSQPKGPANFGFAIAVDPQRPETAWVVPGISDGVRVAIDQALVVCRTEDGGQSWQELRQGLPQSHCFDIVYRHALALEEDTLVFGTTTGNVFLSPDRGNHWDLLTHTLPMVHAVCFA